MESMDDKLLFTTRVLLFMEDLGIEERFIHRAHVTMESEKYICVRETNDVVIIDTSKPTHLIRLGITADSAIMNPDSPILAFKVRDDGRTQDQLQIFDIEEKTEIKSYNMAEEVEYWKWITPKMLGLFTHTAVYHWSIEGLTGPVKMFDRTDCLKSEICNYLCDPSEKWLAVIVDSKDYEDDLLIKPYQSGHQWFRIPGVATAAFATFNVEENGTLSSSTLLCYAQRLWDKKEKKYVLRVCVTDIAHVGQHGEPGFGKTRAECYAPFYFFPLAMQISPKEGLIYFVSVFGHMHIHDLETAEAICSHNIIGLDRHRDAIICTTGGTSSTSFYTLDTRGQVLLTNINESTILSFIDNKKLLTRGDLRKLRLQITKLENSLQEETRKKEEAEEQFTRIKIEIEEMKKENIKLQDKIVADTTKSLQVKENSRIEIEQLRSKIKELNKFQESHEEMLNEVEGLKKQIAELTMERDKTIRDLEEFRLWIEGFDSSTNHLEANFIEFTHEELKAVTNDFSDSLKIGEGGYGFVYKAFLGLKPVAIKILKNENRFGNNTFNQEVGILRKLRHPNLVMLLGACTEAQALVYELMPNGSLFDSLRNKQQSNALTWKTRICIASNICSALIVLHSANPHSIVHGDLKSANILLDSNYTGKLCDFGICRHLLQTDTRITPHHYTDRPKGTLPYMDPEYLETGEMTRQCDVYSFGIVLLELVTGRCPMAGFRKSVEAALQKGQNFVDASAGEWPSEEAKRMVLLGLQCSDPSRVNRPDLEKEVWVRIESMRRASLRF